MKEFPPLPLPTLRLRTGTPADLPRLAALLTEVHPDLPVAVETLERRAARRSPGEPFECQLVEHEGRLLGMAEVRVPSDEDHPGWLNVEFATLEPALAPVLLTLAEALAQSQGAHTLITTVLDSWWEKLLYEERGYHEHDRMWPSTLDLTALDFSRFAGQEAKARASGVVLRPLSSFGTFDEAGQRRLHRLWSAVERDIPSAVPLSEWSFETWQRHVLPGLEGREGGLWLAVAPGGDWVGLTGLYEPIPSRPGTLHNDLTGVRPEWRGHSLGLALKLAAARAALERGFTHARTSNHSLNLPMLAINDALGFVRETARIILMKKVGEEDPGDGDR